MHDGQSVLDSCMQLLLLYLFKCSHNIISQEKSLNDTDSFDYCQPSLSKLENRQKVSEALNRLLKVLILL